MLWTQLKQCTNALIDTELDLIPAHLISTDQAAPLHVCRIGDPQPLHVCPCPCMCAPQPLHVTLHVRRIGAPQPQQTQQGEGESQTSDQPVYEPKVRRGDPLLSAVVVMLE